MRLVRYALALLLLIFGWLIGWSNATPLSFSILVWSTDSYPVFIFYFLFLTVGLLLGLTLGRFVPRK